MGNCCSEDCVKDVFNMYAPGDIRKPEAFGKPIIVPENKKSNDDIKKFPGFEQINDDSDPDAVYYNPGEINSDDSNMA
ncbi:hypothetical protein TVAG_350590 [Trichomonas vaginalis G3]|uniref:Uncharacterized protein n=1 Tax=Trichomonas vaginalis (strain ATCC PRA-98 / G3) TaxID=412133 RepID=A2ESK4_TRIV3|nr:hypothetical protein TVAGG3_0034960 [Trichomonas vaginalis G3]EAY04384.1 hypothetical protein TVAG_350590 [Trichomonas vaginalis G3]KAI5540317.1 hypothetical protein TVAGG3_0034960 [Trichomonas vaginalis G3]|eukprot:XP_001316607.1 hypothetical protein [Trichomonas vaginalis G3]